MRLSIIVAALFAAAASASPSRNGYVLHEKREHKAQFWQKHDAVPGEAVLPFRIGLVQHNIGSGHDLLMETSDMKNPKYGQHLSAEEVIEFFAPPQHAVDTVRGWLESAGIASERISQSVNKQWIQFDAKVKDAEELFKTKYYHYAHTGTGNKNIGCEEYHLPSDVSEHVDYVTPGLKMMAGFVHPEKRKRSEEAVQKRGFRTKGDEPFSGPIIIKTLEGLLPGIGASGCDTMVTPECIATFYNITPATKSKAGNELGIFEEGDFFSQTDLTLFWTEFFPKIPPLTAPTVDGIDGGMAPMAVAGGESNLDLMISWPIIYPQKEIIFQTDDIFYALGLEGGGGFLNTFFDAIDGSYCNYDAFGEKGDASIDPKYPDPNPAGYQGQRQCGVYKPTKVISISYGEQEDDLPTNYQQRQCSEILKLALQGVTTVIASGDSGVAARAADDNNSNGCLGKGEVFNPDFPASCPYVVAVGSTFLPPGGNAAKDQEISTTRFPSGGGFSNIYRRPFYQNSAVQTYLNNYVNPYKSYSLSQATNNPTEAQTNGGLYNRAGRGYPDMSAVGDNVIIVLNGVPTLIGGTSASAPVVAAIFNRINEERIAKGRSTIGFVQPTLYSHPSMFHDITNGSNPGCNTTGFRASKGWDPVSGLGTPNYPAMLKVFMG